MMLWRLLIVCAVKIIGAVPSSSGALASIKVCLPCHGFWASGDAFWCGGSSFALALNVYIIVLDRPLHHGSTQGGKSESNKYRHQYQVTLDKYIEVFSGNLALDIWPECEQRFHQADAFVWLNAANYVLLKKPSKSLLLIDALPLLLASCTADDVATVTLSIVSGAIVIYVFYRILKFIAPNQGGNGSSTVCGSPGGSNHNDGSGCGGCGGWVSGCRKKWWRQMSWCWTAL